jgi:O-acetyl-ADP-ribose deacetylase (regulator of RNase III)
MPRKRCFVISPIGEPDSAARKHADIVFHGIIRPAVEELKSEGVDIEPFRSDQLREPGKISEQMFREIFHDDLCIAILTGFNPNVFYELAVAQCAYRPVVALLQQGERPPFDVTDLRIVPYDLDTLRVLERRDAKELAAHLRAMLAESWTPPDPFGPTAPQSWRIMRDPHALQKLIETSRPKPLPPGVSGRYRLPEDAGRRLVIRTGDVRHINMADNVHVLVSSENTDLQLARYYDPSVSGTLRYLDAEKDQGGRVLRDALDERLKATIRQHGIELPVMAGTVIALETTRLAERGIKYVFLAATVRGDGPGAGYSAVVDSEIENCIRECFREFDRRAAQASLCSILFPIFGAGTAKKDPEQAAALLLPVVVECMRTTRSCREVNVLAWVDSHRRALQKLATDLGLQPVS